MINSINNGKEVNYSSFLLTHALTSEEKIDGNSLPINLNNLKKNIAGLFGVEKKENSDKTTDDNALINHKSKSLNANSDPLYDGKVSFVTNSFDSLVVAVGASGNKLTKGQIISYLQKLTSDNSNDNSKEIAFLKTLIAKFDTLANGGEYISSFYGMNDAQDYSTITTEQVTPPIDIRI